MALQDLTPQLRTRLSRMERAVGWFVMLALGCLLFGFGYYVYSTAERKGWFKTKAPYFTFTDRATGLRVGDPVQLMGFDVGQITRIDAQPPDDFYFNVYVEFEIQSPYYGYLWTEGSKARVATADFLGKRVLEVTKGTGGYPTYVFNPVRVVTPGQARELPEPGRWVFGEEFIEPEGTNVMVRAMDPLTAARVDAVEAAGHENMTVLDQRERRKRMTGVWNDKEGRYVAFTPQTKPYWLLSDESPAVTERLEKIVGNVERALPSILALTNHLARVLSNAVGLTSNLNAVAIGAQPVVSNLAVATAQLDRAGGLGEWLLPTNINRKLDEALTGGTAALADARTTMDNANTNLTALAQNLNRSLESLAAMTSNLNAQVQSNTNLVDSIERTIIDADQFIQGLKRHWLLRSAFPKPRPPQERPPERESAPQLGSPKERAK